MNSKAPLDAIVTQTDEAPEPVKEEENRVLLHMPVDIRSAALALLAVLASLYTLYWARAVFIPVLLGLMASYALTPVVDRLQRWHVPRVLASALLLVAIVGSLGWITYKLRDDANALIESLPDVAQRFRQSIEERQGPRAAPSAGRSTARKLATSFLAAQRRPWAAAPRQAFFHAWACSMGLFGCATCLKAKRPHDESVNAFLLLPIGSPCRYLIFPPSCKPGPCSWRACG